MNILIVDDNELERVLLRHLLEAEGFDLLEAESGEQAHTIVQQHLVDLVVIDIMMPGMNGVETVRAIRQVNPKHWFPIVFLSAQEEETLICAALDAGGDDYLIKPVSQKLLVTKVKALARIARLQNELERINLELFQASITDPLTQIHNRMGFLSQLEVQWRVAARETHPLSILMIDVDYFKLYNDTFGHPAGDECLRKIARALKDTLKRPSDLLGRFGGEEFIAMLPSTEIEGAVRVTNAMRQSILALNILSASKSHSLVSISAGAATCTDTKTMPSQELVRLADDALYAAKRAGRNCVCFIAENGEQTIVGES